MKNNRTILFLLFTFIWSWVNWGIALYYLKSGSAQDGMILFMSFFFIGVYGPTLAAIVTTVCLEGSAPLRALMNKLVLWRASPKVYLAIFALPVLFMFFGIWIYSSFIGPIGDFSTKNISYIPAIIGYGLLGGPLGEELGWRGYLLPKLLEKYSSTKSSIVIGVIWFTWHIPLFFGPAGALVSNGDITLLNVSAYLLAVICLAYLFTHISLITNGSVLIAILTHLSVNAGLAIVFFPDLASPENFLTVFKLTIIPLVLFTIYFGFKKAIRFEENTES